MIDCKALPKITLFNQKPSGIVFSSSVIAGLPLLFPVRTPLSKKYLPKICVMTDAAVSSVLTPLAPLIEKKVRQEVTLLLNAGDSVNELNRKLKTIQTVLADAENRRLKEDVRVESWLQKLRDITYEMEDALDEWEVENIKQQLEESEDDSESDSWVEKVRSFLLSTCLCFKQTVHRRRIAQVIEQLIAKLDNLDKENEKEFNFIPKMDNASQPVENHVDQNKTSYEDLSEIRGRDDDKNGLLSMLLGSGDRDDAFKIMSIVGAGGMGKSTLARFLFNANEVKDQFQKRIWICVSDPFDGIKIANQILDALEGEKSVRLSELQPFLQSIEKAVSVRRFFLVLDDVWTEDDAKWKPLKVCLMSGAPGSRILVTTRKTPVAQIMGSTDDDVVDLKRLKDEDCWYILRQKAFQSRTDIECRMLEETGRKIAGRCKGSPLVAKTMGGLLRFREDWESVLQSDMWNLEEVRNDIFPLLKLSYDDLQPEIKRCFTYCAIFPKDKILKVDELVRMWMAQGFVLPSSPIESELQLGHQYFKNLALRCFFQDFQKNDYGHITYCKMHDIVHDFAQFLTKNECLIVEQVDGGEEKKCNEKDVRHLTIISPDGDNVVKGSLNLENLRSFSLKNVRDANANSLILLTHLKRVRLLEIEMRNEREIVMDIPTEIGNLIHLRYLRVSWFKLKELPETIYNLYNLQTLDISSCGDLCGLPKGIHKLRNLRYLINGGISSSFKFPQGFEKLVNLQRLDKFLALRELGNELGLLENLNYLEGKFRIVIDHGVDVMQAKKVNLINKKRIQKLLLLCFKGTSEEVVEALQPCENLQSLIFGNVHWPTWIGTLTKLRSLKFCGDDAYECMGDFFTRSITLPSLECLQIHNNRMERLWVDEAWTTAFPELKTLEFRYCFEWEEWEDISEEQDITVFPKLKELKFYRCGELKSLPHRILGKAPSLVTLEFADCERLKSEYGRMRKEDWEKISSTSLLKISHWWPLGDD